MYPTHLERELVRYVREALDQAEALAAIHPNVPGLSILAEQLETLARWGEHRMLWGWPDLPTVPAAEMQAIEELPDAADSAIVERAAEIEMLRYLKGE